MTTLNAPILDSSPNLTPAQEAAIVWHTTSVAEAARVQAGLSDMDIEDLLETTCKDLLDDRVLLNKLVKGHQLHLQGREINSMAIVIEHDKQQPSSTVLRYAGAPGTATRKTAFLPGVAVAFGIALAPSVSPFVAPSFVGNGTSSMHRREERMEMVPQALVRKKRGEEDDSKLSL